MLNFNQLVQKYPILQNTPIQSCPQTQNRFPTPKKETIIDVVKLRNEILILSKFV